ncbi:MAG: deoxyguanosinetriphosphate triphosphohydrolase [Gammaproteobacteria bacterium]|nr:deoxyguanosinetriphosphate triphosphohydrolase [Gammaproteobacteria bacterium]
MNGMAAYAASEASSQGRRYTESPPAYRSEYQRDRDRIIHAVAFRRLIYKTQVFVNHEGDLFRTRLTHSLEVAQLSRTIAKSLGLNEDLSEAIALAHDLGHPPFGHAGQDALNQCMRRYGGFEHNLQSLRIVDELEQKYPDFDGLNLMFETREGIVKHCSRKKAKELGALGERFLNGEQPGLEAQLVNLADEIAYNSHDTDDGLRANIVTIDQLRTQSLFDEQYMEVTDHWPQLAQRQSPRRLIHAIIRGMINAQVKNLIETSHAQLEAVKPKDSGAVRASPDPLITFSALMYEQHLELKRFLYNNLYQYYRVYRMSIKAKQIIQRLFEAFGNDIHLLPPEQRLNVQHLQPRIGADAARAQVAADYIAGMTDRYAISEYERLYNPTMLP